MDWIFGLHFKSSKIRNDFRNSAPERAASQLLLNLTNFPDNLSHFINKLCGSSSPLVLNSAHTVSLIEGDILILQKSQNCVEQSLFLIEGILDGFWQHFGISSTFKKIESILDGQGGSFVGFFKDEPDNISFQDSTN